MCTSQCTHTAPLALSADSLHPQAAAATHVPPEAHVESFHSSNTVATNMPPEAHDGNPPAPKRVKFVDELAKKDKSHLKPAHVQSIKSVSAHTIPPPNTVGPSSFRKSTLLDASAATQSPDHGEGVVVPEHRAYASDLETCFR